MRFPLLWLLAALVPMTGFAQTSSFDWAVDQILEKHLHRLVALPPGSIPGE